MRPASPPHVDVVRLLGHLVAEYSDAHVQLARRDREAARPVLLHAVQVAGEVWLRGGGGGGGGGDRDGRHHGGGRPLRESERGGRQQRRRLGRQADVDAVAPRVGRVSDAHHVERIGDCGGEARGGKGQALPPEAAHVAVVGAAPHRRRRVHRCEGRREARLAATDA
eukprot:scaffold9713_cov42-Phaeocystis_antarctica.AAC.1